MVRRAKRYEPGGNFSGSPAIAQGDKASMAGSDPKPSTAPATVPSGRGRSSTRWRSPRKSLLSSQEATAIGWVARQDETSESRSSQIGTDPVALSCGTTASASASEASSAARIVAIEGLDAMQSRILSE
jgi:hypothetical protein